MVAHLSDVLSEATEGLKPTGSETWTRTAPEKPHSNMLERFPTISKESRLYDWRRWSHLFRRRSAPARRWKPLLVSATSPETSRACSAVSRARCRVPLSVICGEGDLNASPDPSICMQYRMQPTAKSKFVVATQNLSNYQMMSAMLCKYIVGTMHD